MRSVLSPSPLVMLHHHTDRTTLAESTSPETSAYGHGEGDTQDPANLNESGLIVSCGIRAPEDTPRFG
jgi:hypothetical protein